MDHQTVRELTAAYSLDALDRADEHELEEHLARCPDCREELASFREAAAMLAHDVDAPAPPAGLRERILEQARSERPNVVPLRRRWALPAAATLAAAAACLAIGLGIWAVSLSGQLDTEREALDNQERLVAVLGDTDARRFPVEGVEGTLIRAASGEAALLVSNLEPAPSGKTYEAWVIEDGKPLPAGLFASGGERTAFALGRPVPAGAIVAVTLEREGGVESPTGEPLFSTRAV
jgi:anti-sigma factor RsiW